MVRGVVPLDQEPGPVVVDDEPQSPDGGGDHRRPARLRLERHQAEGLRPGGHEHHVRGGVHVGQARLRQRREEHHALAHAERRGELHQPGDLAALRGPARTPHDREHQVLRELRVLRDRLGERPHRDVGPLVRLETPDEQREPKAREMEPVARGRALAREEDRVVHAGWHDPDVVGIGPVEPHELGRLRRRRSQDPVGPGDHPLLAGQARRRLGRLAPSERVVLDLAERVERGHEGQAEDVLRRVADPPREPVVAVQDVVALPVDPRPAKHPTQELRQEPRQIGLGDRSARAGLEGHEPHTCADLEDLRSVGAAAAGEQVDLDLVIRQSLGHRADVHVHAAGVAGAGLIHRRRVHGEHGDPWFAHDRDVTREDA